MTFTLLSFGLIILAGIVFRRLNAAQAAAVRHSINLCVFNVFLPALCLTIFYTAIIDSEALLVPLTAALSISISLAAAYLVYLPLSKRMGLDSGETGILIIASAFGNVTYLGLPIIIELYGVGAAKYPIYYDLLATTPILWIAGAQIAVRFASSPADAGASVSISSSLRTIALLPPLWGCLAGAVLQAAHVPMPEFILKALTMLGGLVTPLMIFSVGLAITVPNVKHAAVAAPAALIKLAVSPLVAFAAARLLGVQATALKSCVIEGAMPTMVLSLLIADKFKLNTPLAAFMIVATTALSFVVLPIAAHMISGF
ncbi:MAG: AEC family transporter [Nitrospirae bacterium]|nr:AEC family transporter [Nitrospirota bacterium]